MTRDGITLFVRVFDDRTETTFAVNALTVVATRSESGGVILSCSTHTLELVDLVQYLDSRLSLAQTMGFRSASARVRARVDGIETTLRFRARGVAAGWLEFSESGLRLEATHSGAIVKSGGLAIARQSLRGEIKDLGVATPSDAMLVVACAFLELLDIRMSLLGQFVRQLSIEPSTAYEIRSATCFATFFKLRSRLDRKRQRLKYVTR
jgi:hypothetical protein